MAQVVEAEYWRLVRVWFYSKIFDTRFLNTRFLCVDCGNKNGIFYSTPETVYLCCAHVPIAKVRSSSQSGMTMVRYMACSYHVSRIIY